MNQSDRPRYFEGQYLGAADLSAAVDYTRQRQARHELGGHVWGIAAGLELVEQKLANGAVQVSISPGYAWDGYGRPIVVLAPIRLTSEMFRNYITETAPEGDIVKVWLRYDEAESQNPAPGFEQCHGNQHSRVAESFAVMVGEVDTGQKVVVNGRSVDADSAATVSNTAAPKQIDKSVPYQEFPDTGATPVWPVPIGYVRWFKDKHSPGYLVARDDSGSGGKARDSDSIRSLRRYIGVIAEEVLAADGAIRLRDRNKTPSTHFQPPVQTPDPAHPNDLLWVEGAARVEGDARLAGGQLEWRDAGGQFSGVPMLARRNEKNTFDGKNLEIGFSSMSPTPSGKHRVVLGPVNIDAAGAITQIEPKVVIRDDARVGINKDDPQGYLHIKSDDARQGELQLFSSTADIEYDGGNDKLFLFKDNGGKTSFMGGNIGMGTMAPTARLHLTTDNPYQGNLQLFSASADFEYDGGSDKLFVFKDTGGKTAFMGGNVGIGTDNPTLKLQINGDFGNAGPTTVHLWDSRIGDTGSARLFIRSVDNGVVTFDGTNNKVGIGTSSPTAKLDVRGSIKLGNAGNYFALGALQDWRMIAGSVSAIGNITADDFTCVKISSGYYRVRFTGRYSSTPVIVATLVDTANRQDKVLTVITPSDTGFDVVCVDTGYEGGDENQYKDSAFNFIAVGPRA